MNNYQAVKFALLNIILEKLVDVEGVSMESMTAMAKMGADFVFETDPDGDKEKPSSVTIVPFGTVQ